MVFGGFVLLSVPREGVEPSCLATHDFESCAYTNSATEAIFTFVTRLNYWDLILTESVQVADCLFHFFHKHSRNLLK